MTLLFFIAEEPLKRKNYSPLKLEKALLCIESGEETSIAKVSKQFNIPRTTLLYKTNGQRPQDRNRTGPEPMLGMNFSSTPI